MQRQHWTDDHGDMTWQEFTQATRRKEDYRRSRDGEEIPSTIHWNAWDIVIKQGILEPNGHNIKFLLYQVPTWQEAEDRAAHEEGRRPIKVFRPNSSWQKAIAPRAGEPQGEQDAEQTNAAGIWNGGNGPQAHYRRAAICTTCGEIFDDVLAGLSISDLIKSRVEGGLGCCYHVHRSVKAHLEESSLTQRHAIDDQKQVPTMTTTEEKEKQPGHPKWFQARCRAWKFIYQQQDSYEACKAIGDWNWEQYEEMIPEPCNHTGNEEANPMWKGVADTPYWNARESAEPLPLTTWPEVWRHGNQMAIGEARNLRRALSKPGHDHVVSGFQLLVPQGQPKSLSRRMGGMHAKEQRAQLYAKEGETPYNKLKNNGALQSRGEQETAGKKTW